MRRLRRLLPIVLLLGILLTSTALPLTAQDGGADDSPTPTSPPPVAVIRVWWSDALYPLADESVEEILREQIDAFNREHSDLNAEFRLKPTLGTGSILTTLLAAVPVAPSAIPDLVLLRRNDLVQAVRGGVVRPIDNWLPDTLRSPLLPNVINLGLVDGILYGFPYTITVQHTAYDVDVLEQSPETFEDILANSQRLLLPGAPVIGNEVNDTVLAQYLSAGGRLVDGSNVPTLDQEPLLEVLNFYADGLESGIFAEDVLSYTQIADYWARTDQSTPALAIVNSALYLENGDTPSLAIAPIPTIDGKTLVIINGWVWALTTDNPDQQRHALEFLEWIMGGRSPSRLYGSL